jgi:hypothetical protein
MAGMPAASGAGDVCRASKAKRPPCYRRALKPGRPQSKAESSISRNDIRDNLDLVRERGSLAARGLRSEAPCHSHAESTRRSIPKLCTTFCRPCHRPRRAARMGTRAHRTPGGYRTTRRVEITHQRASHGLAEPPGAGIEPPPGIPMSRRRRATFRASRHRISKRRSRPPMRRRSSAGRAKELRGARQGQARRRTRPIGNHVAPGVSIRREQARRLLVSVARYSRPPGAHVEALTVYRRCKRIRTPLGIRVVQDSNAYEYHPPTGLGALGWQIWRPFQGKENCQQGSGLDSSKRESERSGGELVPNSGGREKILLPVCDMPASADV